MKNVEKAAEALGLHENNEDKNVEAAHVDDCAAEPQESEEASLQPKTEGSAEPAESAEETDNEAEPAEEAVDYLANEEATLNEFLHAPMPALLPPVIKQYVDIAPEGWKEETALSLLPVLGTIGSRLRARFIDGRMHSPTIYVTIVAEQGKGKQKLTDIANECLQCIDEVDQIGRTEEDSYSKQMNKMSKSGVKVSKKDLDAMPDQPEPIVRIIPPRTSYAKAAPRIAHAGGAHCIIVASELSQMVNTMKKSFGLPPEFFCDGFDNAKTGQEYQNKESYCGFFRIYLNLLFTGTPAAAEDLFTMKNQKIGFTGRFIIKDHQTVHFQRPPMWGKMNKHQRAIVDETIRALDSITIKRYSVPDGKGVMQEHIEVNPEYVMKLDWLNHYIEEWEEDLRQKASNALSFKADDLYLRCGLVGFRVGMLVYALFGQKNSKRVKQAVCEFAVWVASQMLLGLFEHMKDFETSGSKIGWPELYAEMGNEFTKEELVAAMAKHEIRTNVKFIIHTWSKKQGLIKGDKEQRSSKFTKIENPFFQKG